MRRHDRDPGTLTWSGVTARRMARHALAEPATDLDPASGAAAARALTPSGQAGNYPVLLVDGEVGGVWHQRRSGRKLAITVESLGELTVRQRRDRQPARVNTTQPPGP
jgi:hypothetical protein